MPHEEILTFEEITRIAKIFVSLGIEKIRLTGGEPTVRKDLPALIKMIKSIDGLKDTSLTTNGYFLDTVGQAIFDAGLKRINISLDTLKKEKFQTITRTNHFDKVLDSIRIAKTIGFDPIKVNAVIIRDYNDDEILDFIGFAKNNLVQPRFIEFMPLDGDDNWERNKVFTKKEIIELIKSRYKVDTVSNNPHDPATLYSADSTIFGVISSISEPFCFNCNRVRITADGKLRTCLFSIIETDLKTPIRNGASDDEVRSIIKDKVFLKELGHFVNTTEFQKPDRSMYSIGG